jgi:hypothetical protein
MTRRRLSPTCVFKDGLDIAAKLLGEAFSRSVDFVNRRIYINDLSFMAHF